MPFSHVRRCQILLGYSFAVFQTLCSHSSSWWMARCRVRLKILQIVNEIDSLPKMIHCQRVSDLSWNQFAPKQYCSWKICWVCIKHRAVGSKSKMTPTYLRLILIYLDMWKAWDLAIYIYIYALGVAWRDAFARCVAHSVLKAFAGNSHSSKRQVLQYSMILFEPARVRFPSVCSYHFLSPFSTCLFLVIWSSEV